MEVVEDTLSVPLERFLDRPLFSFLGQQSDGGPRLSPLWFLWADGSVWHIAQLGDRSYPDRVRQYPRSAVGIVDFDPEDGRVEHVGMRGEATLRPYDETRADRLLRKYLGSDRDCWPERFRAVGGDGYRLIRFDPATVVARDQSYPMPADDGG